MDQPIDYSQLPHKSHKAVIGDIILTPLLVVSLVFGAWAFSKMQHYKNISDREINAAAAIAADKAVKNQKAIDDEAAKSPNKIFTGSPIYGSVTFKYPKTWSGYVDSNSSEPINGYFYPAEVPGLQLGVPYALRLEMVNDDYSSVVQQMDNQIRLGKVTSKAYVFPKMASAKNLQPGTRFDGLIDSAGKVRGAMVVMRVRDKTLKIYTQSPDFLNDFDNTILANLTFSP